MQAEDLSSFYISPDIHALVSFTKGEGYGLPLLEAASSALPVLVTKWSGHMDFMRNIKFSGFEYELEKIHPSRVDNEIFVEESRWAQPKESDVKSRLLKIKKSYKVPKKWATDGQKYINSNYSQEEIFKKYEEVLSEYLT